MLLSRHDTDVLCLDWKIVNFVIDKGKTCNRGNSSACPRRSLNPVSSVKTDPSLTLKILWLLQRLNFLKPVKVPVDDHLQSSICARSCFPDLSICRSSCLHLQATLDLGNRCHLHLLHKVAVVRLLQVRSKIKSATHSSVSDDRSEYLRTVYVLSSPPALSKHVSLR